MSAASDGMLFQIWPPIALCVVASMVAHWIGIWGWGLHPWKWKPWSQVTWRRTDYVWLSLTALSILPLAYQAHRFAADNDWATNFRNVDFAQQQLANAVTRFDAATCGWTPGRSEFSPSNFDALEDQRRIACDHARKLPAFLSGLLESRDRAKDFEVSFAPPKELVERGWIERYEVVSWAFKNLADMERKEALFEKRRVRGDLEKLLLVFAPYILGLGVAIRLARTTADVLHEKKRMSPR